MKSIACLDLDGQMENNDSEYEKSEKVSWWPFALIVFGVSALWLGSPFLIERIVVNWEFQKLGVFGDSFGAVNALFSGLAFTGLFYAILLQRKELELQRRELRSTRKVLQSQKHEAEKQNATLAQQTFENTFFQLLRHHVEITNDMKTSTPGLSHTGRACFEIYFERMVSSYSNISSNPSVERSDVLKTVVENLTPSMDQSVGHYLRSLHNILDFIDTSQVEQKRRYARFVTDQLSSSELSVILYCCMFADKYRTLKALLERYSVLRNITQYDLLERVEYKSHYLESAFRQEN
jgi:Putative phage abortive infection protein